MQTSERTHFNQQAVVEAGGAHIVKFNEISYQMQCSRQILFYIGTKIYN